jgi:hypothetical protein
MAVEPLVGLSVADAVGPVDIEAHETTNSRAMDNSTNFLMKNLPLSK